MAKRLENPNVDAHGFAGVVLTADEFEQFLGQLKATAANRVDIERAAKRGFLICLERSPSTTEILDWLKFPADADFGSVCREGSESDLHSTIADLAMQFR